MLLHSFEKPKYVCVCECVFVREWVCMCCRSCGNCARPHWHSPLRAPSVILSASSQARAQPGELPDRQTRQMGAVDFSNITTAFHQKPCWPASSTMSTLTTETNSSHHPQGSHCQTTAQKPIQTAIQAHKVAPESVWILLSHLMNIFALFTYKIIKKFTDITDINLH